MEEAYCCGCSAYPCPSSFCSPCFGVEGCRGLLALALIGGRQVSRALSHLPQYLGRRFGVAPKDEAEHLIKCLVCGRWIDYRNLLEVFEHAGPLPHPAKISRNDAAARSGLGERTSMVPLIFWTGGLAAVIRHDVAALQQALRKMDSTAVR